MASKMVSSVSCKMSDACRSSDSSLCIDINFCRLLLFPKQLVDYYQTVVDSKHATAPGAKCPDATFMDSNGNSHSLSDFIGKGKYLYIDLWARWCGPCCAEIPYLEKHVAHYKDNDRIQFVSISIDNDKQAWRNKLEKDKPQWHSLSHALKRSIRN